MVQKTKKSNKRSLWPSALGALALVSALSYNGVMNSQYRAKVGDPREDDVLVEKASEILSFDNLLDLRGKIYSSASAGNEQLLEKSNQELYQTLLLGYQKALSGVLKAEFGQFPPEGSVHDLVNINFKKDYLDRNSNKKGIEAILNSFDSSDVMRVSHISRQAYREALSSFTESEQRYLIKIIPEDKTSSTPYIR